MPSTALDAIARLHRLVPVLEAGDGDAQWLASRLQRYLNGAPRGGGSLDLCLDLTPAQGNAPWWEVERIDQRNAVIRAMAANHFAAQEPAPAAKGVMAAWRRYSRNRKAIDLRHGATAAEPGTLDADLFELALFGGPPAERRVRDILANAEQSAAA